MRVQTDLADALDRAVAALGQHRHIGQASWEGDMPLKVGHQTAKPWTLDTDKVDVKLISACTILSAYLRIVNPGTHV